MSDLSKLTLPDHVELPNTQEPPVRLPELSLLELQAAYMAMAEMLTQVYGADFAIQMNEAAQQYLMILLEEDDVEADTEDEGE